MPKGKVIKDGEGLQYGFSDTEWKALNKSKRSRIRHPDNHKQSYKKWAAKQSPEYHRKRVRKSNLKLSYNLTEEDYDNMLLAQSNKCAICSTDTPTGKWKVFAVDHCHITGNIRGLLCNECNRGMGLLGDSEERLRLAADYLKAHALKTKLEKGERLLKST